MPKYIEDSKKFFNSMIVKLYIVAMCDPNFLTMKNNIPITSIKLCQHDLGQINKFYTRKVP